MSEGKDSNDKTKGQQPKKLKKREFMPVSCSIFEFLSKGNLIPINWDNKKKLFSQLPLKSFRTLHYILALHIAIFDFVFVVAKFIQIIAFNWPINTNDVVLGEAIALFSLLGTKSICLASHYHVVSKRNEIVTFANKLFRLKFSDGLWKDFAIAKIFMVAISARLAQYVVTSFTKPRKIRFWYSVLSQGWQTTPIFIIHLIFNIQTTFMYFTVLFHLANILLYTETMESKLLQRTEMIETYYDRLLSYRKLQVLAVEFRAAYAIFGIPYITLYSFLMSTVLAFGSIRYYDTLDFRVYMQMPLSLFMLSAFAKAFYSNVGNQPGNSRKALKSRFQTEFTSSSINRFGHKDESRIYLKSCRDISLFKIRTTFLPLLLRFVVFKTTRLLIVSSQG